MASNGGEWKKTACILCSENCGIEVQLDGRRFAKIRGDKDHPASRGYLCQKAARLDYYQNHADRLTSPLRRRGDGSFEEISWDEAIGEIAERLVGIRDGHGSHALAYAGGGGQGNHLCGLYGNALKQAMGTRYHYSSLAQEKTGGFWVNGHLFGKQSCHPTPDVESADYIMFIGTNPWQSHGFPQARKVLHDINKDPDRTMVVIDPWRTQTAELADVHLAVRPGRDAFLLAAMLGVIFQDGLENKAFLAEWTEGAEQIGETFRAIPVDRYAEFAGLDPALVRRVAREYATTQRATIRTDLGLEHTLHSTLNDYLGKLLFLVTGHFARPGCNNLHGQFLPIIGHSGGPESGAWKTRVTGAPEIARLFPPNVLPQEIDTDHPERIRGVVVESMNPVASGADTQAYRDAFEKLELLVVIDVAMTETAEVADYVLPASSQYEKWEATFFGSGVPAHHFHLRAPLLEPLEGTLPEPEIHRRLLLAMGETPQSIPLLGAQEQMEAMAPDLGDGSDNFRAIGAPIYMACQTYAGRFPEEVAAAGIKDNGQGAGAGLFSEIVNRPSGVEIGRFDYAKTFEFIRHGDGKIHLVIEELLGWLRGLDDEIEQGLFENVEYPFMLSAGGRRSYNANTICRDPEWRRKDSEGALWIHPADLERLGVASGDAVVCESSRGSVVARAEADEGAQPGFVALPHGYGTMYPDAEGKRVATGPMVNVLTESDYCDPIAKTPYHKNLRVRIRAFDPAEVSAGGSGERQRVAARA